MTVYELHTNEGVTLVRHDPRPRMLAYIREKIAQGMPLSRVVYCWVPKVLKA
jgi:hypothetical protein